MNKFITTVCLIVLALLASFDNSSADDTVFETTVQPFIAALKAGDVDVLKSYVGGILYQNITEASGQDEDYGKFLRSRYAKATFHPTVLQEEENKIIVRVNVDFAEEGTSVFELLVEKNSAGSWRVIDQYSP